MPKPRGHRLRAAGRPGAEPRRVVDARRTRRRAGAAEAGPALARVSASSPRPRRPGSGGDPEQDHVVDDVRVAGQHVGAGEPGVLVQLRVEQEAAVVVGADAGRRGRACTPRASSAWLRRSPSRSGGRLAGLRAAAACRGAPLRGVGSRRSVACRSTVVRRSSDAGRRRRARPRGAARARRAASRSRRAAHPGGQVIGRPAEQVQVGVEDGLPGAGAGVEDQPVVVVPLGRRDRGRGATRSASAAGSAAASSAAFGVVVAAGRRARGRRLRVEVAERDGASVVCTTSPGMSPATILQNRQSSALMPAHRWHRPSAKPVARRV